MKSDGVGSAKADSAAPSLGTSPLSVPAPVQSPGQMLRQERERRGLTLQQAAEDLNLDRWIVEAIEVDHFLALGAPVYARGHLRKYAALLGLSQDLIVDRYDSLAGTPSAPVVTSTTSAHMPRRTRRQRSFWKPLSAALLAATIALGAVWGYKKYDVAKQASNTTLSNDFVAAAASTGANVAAVPANQVSLRLEFTSPAFVEVVDATGQRLMLDTGQPGSLRELRGAAPLAVIVSTASAVRVQVNARDVVIPRLPGKDATRFTVDADGTVR